MTITDYEYCVIAKEKKLNRNINKLSYLNNLNDISKKKYENILKLYLNIIELNNNNNSNILKIKKMNIIKINKLIYKLKKDIKEQNKLDELKEPKKLKKLDELKEPKKLKKLKELNNKSINEWFNNNIIKDDTKKILRSNLYPNYRDYCENNDLLTMKKCELFESMHDIMGHTRKLNSGNIYYIGYEFKEKV